MRTKEKYNNCFTLSGKTKRPLGVYDIGTQIKIYDDGEELSRITTSLEAYSLSGGVNGKQCDLYALSYENAYNRVNEYLSGDISNGGKSLRVSLYLNNAMFGDLHIFVIDFDEADENSSFFKAAYKLADKVTRSKSGGYHMFYGVNKEVAHPLFDSINLLASQSAAAWVSRTAAWTNDGNNKVDMFCDATRLIYEFEEWDNSKGLTDKTQELFELIRDNFTLTRPIENYYKDAEGNSIVLEYLSEEDMVKQMNDAQRLIFEDLKTISSDCSQGEWFRTGIDIKSVFGEYNNDTDIDLGGSVWLWWSAQGGERFQPHSCVNTWDSIINNDNTKLWNRKWKEIIRDVEVFGV